MVGSTRITASDINVSVFGPVSQEDVDYARQKVATGVKHASEPVLFARVMLTRLTDPAVERPAIAQVNVDFNGRPLHAEAARPTMREAVDELHDRLRDLIERAARDWPAIRGRRRS